MTASLLVRLASVGRPHIVAIAILGTFTFAWLFRGEYLVVLPLLVGLDWFLVNLLNRVVDLREDTANGIAGTDLVARNRRAILVFGFGTLGVSLVATAVLVPRLLPLRAAYHALGLAYNWPIRAGWRRLKQLYFFKNAASATGFLLTCFGYPLATAGGLARGITPVGIAVAGLYFFLFELSYEVIYDLRDAPGDALAGARTYPVVHGERGAVRIVDGLLAASLGVLAGGYAGGLVPWRIAAMGVAPILQLVLYKRALRRGITSAFCVGITWLGAALLGLYHGWVLLGLPGVGSE